MLRFDKDKHVKKYHIVDSEARLASVGQLGLGLGNRTVVHWQY